MLASCITFLVQKRILRRLDTGHLDPCGGGLICGHCATRTKRIKSTLQSPLRPIHSHAVNCIQCGAHGQFTMAHLDASHCLDDGWLHHLFHLWSVQQSAEHGGRHACLHRSSEGWQKWPQLGLT